MERPITADIDGNVCFACSPTNARGLRLSFVQVGERAVECRWTAPEHVCGAPGIVHGGIQATLLDETMGYACRTVTGRRVDVVTVELSLRYRRPLPVGVPLVARAEVSADAPPDLTLEGTIGRSDDPTGRPLTTATARWRRLG